MIPNLPPSRRDRSSGTVPAIAATLIGVLVAALLGVFAGGFHLLRSDVRRVEGKPDNLVLALARAGNLTDPPSPELGDSGSEG